MIPVIKRAKEGSNFPEARGLCFFPDVMRLPYDLNNRLRRTDNLPQEKKEKKAATTRCTDSGSVNFLVKNKCPPK
ncbi:hypothetical protein LEP1GSC124_0229, partial [Leptospira interrogans serovar Pyrogenes str. 200701872]